jgi:hypothetical protein
MPASDVAELTIGPVMMLLVNAGRRIAGAKQRQRG